MDIIGTEKTRTYDDDPRRCISWGFSHLSIVFSLPIGHYHIKVYMACLETLKVIIS